MTGSGDRGAHIPSESPPAFSGKAYLLRSTIPKIIGWGSAVCAVRQQAATIEPASNRIPRTFMASYFLIPKQYRLLSNVLMYTRPLARERPLQ